MLQYNFVRVIKARGIEKPYAFLKQAGFSNAFAGKVAYNRVKRLNVTEMEKLCILLRCTPNDMLEWIPEKDQDIDQKHPLNEIKQNDKIFDISKTLNSVPLSKLNEIDELINAWLEKRNTSGQ